MISLKKLYITLITSIVLVLAASCSHKTEREVSAPNIMQSSKMLRIEQRDGFRLASVMSAKDSNIVEASYILVEKNSELPGSLPNGVVLHIPLDNVVAFSSVIAGAFDELGCIDAIKGVVDAVYFKHPAIVAGLKDGSVIDLGPASGLSNELLAAARPQAIFMNIYDGMDVKGIDKTGIPIIKMADNLENDPIARAEWIRFIGILMGTEEKADSIFSFVKSEYARLKTLADTFKEHPRVLTDNMYQGVWYVPGGGSFQAKMIRDAGGNYIWKDDSSTGSLNLSYEEVLAKAHDADIWLLKLFGVKHLDAAGMREMDDRYKNFKCLSKGEVYYSNTEESTLFEDLPFHPERLLSDYVALFHPESGIKLKYFSKIDN